MAERTCLTPDECLQVDPAAWERHVATFRARARSKLEEAVIAGNGKSALHWRLLAEVVGLDPRDWDGYGLLDRWAEHYEGSSGDCSSGCRFYVPLDGELGPDWGVCTNPASHRAGKLTFEHQGCPQFGAADERT